MPEAWPGRLASPNDFCPTGPLRVWLCLPVTIECARTARWYATLWALPALVMLGVSTLFAGSEVVGLLTGTLLSGMGVALLAMALRACLTPLTLTATPDELTVRAAPYFREPVTIGRDRIEGDYFGTRPSAGTVSARHTALVISMPEPIGAGMEMTSGKPSRSLRPGWTSSEPCVCSRGACPL